MFDPAARVLLSDLFHDKRGRTFGFYTVTGNLAGIVAAGVAIVVLVPVLVLFALWSREEIRISVDRTGRVRDGGATALTSHLRRVLVAYTLIVFASIGVTSFLPTLLISVYDFSLELAGATLALLYGVKIVVKPIAGWLSDHVPRHAVVVGTMMIASVSLGLLVAGFTVIAVIGYVFGQRSFPPPFIRAS